MQTTTFSNREQMPWSRGPWDQEPDKIQWIHNGLDCLMVRGPAGAWCGYVGVPPSHPLFERSYQDVDGIYVHGGLTFSDKCAEHGNICHTGEVASAEVWWLGFDCAHTYDLTPAFKHIGISMPTAVYRNMEYVKYQVEGLANQLKEMQ